MYKLHLFNSNTFLGNYKILKCFKAFFFKRKHHMSLNFKGKTIIALQELRMVSLQVRVIIFTISCAKISKEIGKM